MRYEMQTNVKSRQQMELNGALNAICLALVTVTPDSCAEDVLEPDFMLIKNSDCESIVIIKAKRFFIFNSLPLPSSSFELSALRHKRIAICVMYNKLYDPLRMASP